MRTWQCSRRHMADLVAIIFTVCTNVFVWKTPFRDHGRMPGDFGDPMWNLFSLEHLYRSVKFEESFWNPQYLWPLKGVGAFSDTHLGSGLFYIAPRLFGLGMFDSYRVWYIIGIIASSISAYLASRFIRMRPLSASVVGIVYGCSFPITAQIGHAQLIHRWAAPWALVMCVPIIATRFRLYDRILVFTVAITLQFLCNSGLAIGTVLLALPIALSSSFWRDHKTNIKPQGTILNKSCRVVTYLILLLGGYVAATYYFFQLRYHLSRQPSEIWGYSPTFKSLFFADHSRIWAGWSSKLFFFGGRWEVQMFLGLMLIVLAGISVVFQSKYWGLSLVSLLSALSMVLLIVRIGDSSIFIKIAELPGFSSVRTPARFWLIALFPIGLMAGIGIEAIVQKHSRLSRVLASLLIALMVYEYGAVELSSQSEDDYFSSVYKLQSEIDIAIDLNPEKQYKAFLFRDNENNSQDFTAFLTAQFMRFPTLNGAMEGIPYSLLTAGTCSEAKKFVDSALLFSSEMTNEKIDAKSNEVLIVGCQDAAG